MAKGLHPDLLPGRIFTFHTGADTCRAATGSNFAAITISAICIKKASIEIKTDSSHVLLWS